MLCVFLFLFPVAVVIKVLMCIPLGTVQAQSPATLYSRRRTENVPINASVPGPLARPSGRFDALVDMGNPMKGIILFPYLQRREDGRALRAMAPAPSLELCRTVAEVVLPRRWPREVRCC